MGLKWTDVHEIALFLATSKPEADPRYVNFVELHHWVRSLDDFDDVSAHCGERVLEAIQAAWIDKMDEEVAIDN